MTKRKILVVDDDAALRDAYDLSLSDEYEVIAAVDGIDGIQKYNQTAPAMVFLDLRMPRMDGIGVLKHIRQNDSATPVYIVTAFAKEYMDELVKARDDGATFEVASKPLGPQQILKIVRSVLADH